MSDLSKREIRCVQVRLCLKMENFRKVGPDDEVDNLSLSLGNAYP